jgi:murein DD-endopeptidase MepM/ murein hydrolase activator NlpD
MRPSRYTVLIANRNTGSVRRFTLARIPVIVTVAVLFSIPTLVGLGARWAGRGEVEALRQTNENLRLENENYRGMTTELTDQVSSLQSAIDELSKQAELDPATRNAVNKLPSSIRSRAMGGGFLPSPLALQPSTENTFGMLKDLLGTLEDRLTNVRRGVEGRQALAAATPSMWPLSGWLTSNYGSRTDPITGEIAQHSGMDIAAQRGTRVQATADGEVQLAAFNGAYGMSIELDHGYGITTRYGHLSRYGVSVGQKVKRGDVIGYVGATGRTTGTHLHYEVLLNGKTQNPGRFVGR